MNESKVCCFLIISKFYRIDYEACIQDGGVASYDVDDRVPKFECYTWA